jgi:uroporphyrinogen-III synthase
VGGKAPAVTIGPETTRVARSVGLEVVAEATTHDLDGLVAAVRDVMDSSPT